MKEILFFSTNKGKIKEIKKLFVNIPTKVLSLNDFNFNEEIEENGKTFFENAKIKSDFGFKKFGVPCFADDSGICISILNDKPGVSSKRFLEDFSNKKDCFNFILKKTRIENRAYFKTVICLTLKNSHTISFEGVINGKISEKISGKGGFGYDPIFVPNGFNKTFAEMSLRQKNIMSHRSIATNKLISFIIN